MIELYGITRHIVEKGIGMGFEVKEDRELVATFSSEDKLERFLKPRLLKNPIEECGFEPGRKFYQNSDMGHFNDYETVEIEEPKEVPHDPA